MSKDWNLIGLDDLGVLRFRGAEAQKFLQGQVSNDVEKLSAERSQLAGYHNPQGRVIALVRLVQQAPDDVLAVLPRELVATVASRLTKFVLRAKVKITDESSAWRVTGLVAPHSPPLHWEPGAGHEGAVTHEPAAGHESETTHEPVAGAAGTARPTAAGVAPGVTAAGAAPGVTGAASNGNGGVTPIDVSAEFEARSKSWAAAQFESARAVVAASGELSAAAQLEEAESVVELPTASAVMLPDTLHSQSISGGTVIVRVGMTPARWLMLSPAGESVPLSGCVSGERDAWRLLDIADGVAQVYAATSEEFVAQMLNLDALGGIAFDKGCYTGQEVIARAHYRGRVKRRMQRFFSRDALKLVPGESGKLGDGRAFKVVDAVQLANGRCEFLAVAPMVGAAVAEGAEESAAGAAGAPGPQGAVASEGGVANASAVVNADALPLAYPLPE
jgi:folate-binding protein YgfZ